MFSSYQLKIASFYNILIGNVKQLVPNCFDKDKDGKALYKLVNNVVYGKTMENLTNRIDRKVVSN